MKDEQSIAYEINRLKFELQMNPLRTRADSVEYEEHMKKIDELNKELEQINSLKSVTPDTIYPIYPIYPTIKQSYPTIKQSYPTLNTAYPTIPRCDADFASPIAERNIDILNNTRGMDGDKRLRLLLEAYWNEAYEQGRQSVIKKED